MRKLLIAAASAAIALAQVAAFTTPVANAAPCEAVSSGPPTGKCYDCIIQYQQQELAHPGITGQMCRGQDPFPSGAN